MTTRWKGDRPTAEEMAETPAAWEVQYFHLGVWWPREVYVDEVPAKRHVKHLNSHSEYAHRVVPLWRHNDKENDDG